MPGAKVRRVMTPGKKRRAAAMYGDGMTVKAIAAALDRSFGSVLRALYAEGVEMRVRGRGTRRMTRELKLQAVQMYEQDHTVVEIAEALDRCGTVVYLALQAHGVQMRRRGPRPGHGSKGRKAVGKDSKPSTNSGMQQSKQRQQSPPGGPRDHKYDDKHNPDFDDKNLNSDGK